MLHQAIKRLNLKTSPVKAKSKKKDKRGGELGDRNLFTRLIILGKNKLAQRDVEELGSDFIIIGENRRVPVQNQHTVGSQGK